MHYHPVRRMTSSFQCSGLHFELGLKMVIQYTKLWQLSKTEEENDTSKISIFPMTYLKHLCTPKGRYKQLGLLTLKG